MRHGCSGLVKAHNFIDTADVYVGGLSEQITGQALKNLISRECGRGRG